MTKAELIFKLEQAQTLLDDVGEWAGPNNTQIEGLINSAASSISEALDTIPDTITNN